MPGTSFSRRVSALIFDAAGNALQPSRLARRLGRDAVGLDPVDYAIRSLGFVCVRPMGRAWVIEFEPRVAAPLAVIAAFYQIADLAPNRIVLFRRGSPVRFETFNSIPHAFRRVEALTTMRSRSR